MARIRSVHPGIWTDEAFALLSDSAKILFIAIWTECDDAGAFEWKPLQLKMRLRPATAEDVSAIQVLLSEMIEADLIMKYEIEGRIYGAVRNFMKWQSPRKPGYKIPLSKEAHSYIGKPSNPNIPVPVPYQCGTSTEIRSEREREEEREEEKKLAARECANVVSGLSPASRLAEKIEEAAKADRSKNQHWAMSGLSTAQLWLDEAKRAGIGTDRAEALIVGKVQEVCARDPTRTISKPSYFNKAVTDVLKAERLDRPAAYKSGTFGKPKVPAQ